MSVPTAELTAPAAGAPFRERVAGLVERHRGLRLYAWLTSASLLIAALSLLVPSTPSYDPWSWLIWGREIVHLKLQTTGGPTWKPLPVIFTTAFAPFGRAAPDLWLMVARAGAVMAVATVFRLGLRLTRLLGAGEGIGARGPAVVAGLIAAASLANAGGFISNNALGYSEGLLTALVLVAVDRHLDGERRQAFAVGFFAALDRPEIWLFWGPYGLWLCWRDPGARRLVGALFVLIPVLWFLPEYWGSGHFFRGVSRAHTPRSNSPAFARCPFCSELADHAWRTVLLRVKAAALIAAATAGWLLWRARGRTGGFSPRDPSAQGAAGVLAAGALGLGWWLLIAIMTQAGFSGNARYLVLGAALVDIAGGVAWGWFAVEVIRRLPRYAARLRSAASAPVLNLGASAAAVVGFLMLPNWIGSNVIDLQRTHRALVFQAHLRGSAAGAVARLGGSGHIYRCGTVMTEGFQVPMVAWALGVHLLQVQASPLPGEHPPPPNVIMQTRENRHAHLLPALRSWPGTSYRLVLRNRTFRVYEHCAH